MGFLHETCFLFFSFWENTKTFPNGNFVEILWKSPETQ